jgi:peptidoglycan/LPS O-acetylase OafA/YrhL
MMRFNLAEHERTSWNLSGIALDLITGPVFCAAAVAQLVGRPLVYVVTAKGSASTGDTWRTFRPHLLWAAVSLAAIASGLALDHHYPTLHFWAALATLICLAPIAHVAISRLGSDGTHTLTPSPMQELGTVSLPDPRPELAPAEPIFEARQ